MKQKNPNYVLSLFNGLFIVHSKYGTNYVKIFKCILEKKNWVCRQIGMALLSSLCFVSAGSTPKKFVTTLFSQLLVLFFYFHASANDEMSHNVIMNTILWL